MLIKTNYHAQWMLNAISHDLLKKEEVEDTTFPASLILIYL